MKVTKICISKNR